MNENVQCEPTCKELGIFKDSGTVSIDFVMEIMQKIGNYLTGFHRYELLIRLWNHIY